MGSAEYEQQSTADDETESRADTTHTGVNFRANDTPLPGAPHNAVFVVWAESFRHRLHQLSSSPLKPKPGLSGPPGPIWEALCNECAMQNASIALGVLLRRRPFAFRKDVRPENAKSCIRQESIHGDDDDRH